ncbi:ISL3 family transposase, partial [Lentibacillus salicampi]
MSYTYHQFVKETFPQAIRIADRFHVNRYVTNAMHEVRKEVQKTLSSQARKQLKRHHRLLEKRCDMLTTKEEAIVEAILKYDERLKSAY